MDRLSSTGKRIRTDDTSERLVKKPRIDPDAVNQLMEFESTLSARLNAEHSTAIEQIRASLQLDPLHLDLSMLSAATIHAIAPMIPAASVVRLTHLILPDNLHALPDLCKQMKELQYLTLHGFLGRELDLLILPTLRQVSGTVSAMTEEIHLHAHVDIALTTQRLTKLRCHRLLDNGQVRTHALPGQAYYKTLPGRTDYDASSLNCKVPFSGTDIPIVCRHIATYVLSHLASKDIPATPENGYLGIAVPADLAQKIHVDSDAQFSKDLQSSCAYHCVSDTHFGPWVKEQLAAMMAAARSGPLPSDRTVSKSFYALSSSHAMVLVLRYKPDRDEQFVEVFMDPNMTFTHKRNTDNNLDHIATGDRSWRIAGLMPARLLQDYFVTGSTPALLFVEARHRSDDQVPEINLKFADHGLENVYGTLLYFDVTAMIEGVQARLKDLYAQGNARAAPIFTMLQAPHWQLDRFGLEGIVPLGRTDAVKAHLRVIEDFLVWHATLDPHDPASQLPEDFCQRLICPSKSLAEIYSLTDAGHRQALHALLDGIGDLYEKKLISSETCFALLAQPSGGMTLMEKALLAHDEDTVPRTGRLLSQLLQNCAIDADQCGRILDSILDQPAIERLSWTVLRHCPDTMVRTYTDLLLSLGQAAVNNSGDMLENWLGTTTMADWNVEQRLLTRLLFQPGDTYAPIAQLRRDGDTQLADRLDLLARSVLKYRPLQEEGLQPDDPFE